MINPAKIYSVLGNPKSLIPLGVKDASNCAGLTAASYVTGKKEEAQDRFIDEVGTEVIWLGGIPAFKALIDKTVFKLAKLDSKYDIRNLENPEIYKKTLEHADSKHKSAIEKIGQNKKLFKNLNVVKMIAATGLALGAYDVLTDMKQRYTENKLEKKIKKEMEQKREASKAVMNNSDTFAPMKHNNKDLSFKGGLSDFILDPVKNMYILDGGITTQRLAKSRDKQEFAGYAIREGGFLFFMYVMGQKIQDYMVNRADKKFNKSIALDARVLEDENFKSMFTSGKLESDLEKFAEFEPTPKQEKGFIQKVKEFFVPEKLSESQMKSDAKLYDELLKPENSENILVKTAKQSDIISTMKNSEKVDTRRFIDLEAIKDTKSNIKKLYEQYKSSGQDIDSFFKDVRKLKRGSVKTNMFSSMFALGVVLPSVMLAKRIMSNDKEFATEKRIRDRLEANV